MKSKGSLGDFYSGLKETISEVIENLAENRIDVSFQFSLARSGRACGYVFVGITLYSFNSLLRDQPRLVASIGFPKLSLSILSCEISCSSSVFACSIFVNLSILSCEISCRQL